jgi:hypothetical protein
VLATLAILAFCANTLFGFMIFAVTMQTAAFSMPSPWWVKATAITLIAVPAVQAIAMWKGCVFLPGRASISSSLLVLGLCAASVVVEIFVMAR